MRVFLHITLMCSIWLGDIIITILVKGYKS